MSMMGKLTSFLGRHKKAILWLLVIYVLLMILLVVLASGPQDDPFGYDLF